MFVTIDSFHGRQQSIDFKPKTQFISNGDLFHCMYFIWEYLLFHASSQISCPQDCFGLGFHPFKKLFQANISF